MVFLPPFLAAPLTKYGNATFAASANSELKSRAREPNRVASASRKRIAVGSDGDGAGVERLCSSPMYIEV
jgi:hypothetical protein